MFQGTEVYLECQISEFVRISTEHLREAGVVWLIVSSAAAAEWWSRRERFTTPDPAAASFQTDVIVVCVKPQFPQRRQSDGEPDHERDHGSRASCRLRRHRSLYLRGLNTDNSLYQSLSVV